MNKAGQTTRPRALRHATPERVRELLHAYRRRAARYSTGSRDGGNQATRPLGARRSRSTR